MTPGKIRNIERIRNILEAILIIQKFVEGFSFNDFKYDEKTYFACLFQFAIIGEAIVSIDDKILRKYDYPWYKVRSFRNFILHKYHAIDEKLVWDTIKTDVPGLKDIMETILEQEG